MKKDYSTHYSYKKLFKKIKRYSRSAGIKIVYTVLLLFYTLQKPEMSIKEKAMIISALGYFIFPLDALPDFIPIAGYSDDFATLMYVIFKISSHIDDGVKSKAKAKLKTWFKNTDEKSLVIVEKKIFS